MPKVMHTRYQGVLIILEFTRANRLGSRNSSFDTLEMRGYKGDPNATIASELQYQMRAIDTFHHTQLLNSLPDEDEYEFDEQDDSDFYCHCGHPDCGAC